MVIVWQGTSWQLARVKKVVVQLSPEIWTPSLAAKQWKEAYGSLEPNSTELPISPIAVSPE